MYVECLLECFAVGAVSVVVACLANSTVLPRQHCMTPRQAQGVRAAKCWHGVAQRMVISPTRQVCHREPLNEQHASRYRRPAIPWPSLLMQALLLWLWVHHGYDVFDGVLWYRLPLEHPRIAKSVVECHVWCIMVAGDVWVDKEWVTYETAVVLTNFRRLVAYAMRCLATTTNCVSVGRQLGATLSRSYQAESVLCVRVYHTISSLFQPSLFFVGSPS
jgi:hypothetical protein